MRVPSLRTLERLRLTGPNDPVFDILLLSGPLVILAVALGGRSIAATVLVTVYLSSLIGYTLYNGLT